MCWYSIVRKINKLMARTLTAAVESINNQEAVRLFSFTITSWPHPLISPHCLAKAGFYSLGYRDHVKCFSCKVVIGDWEDNDRPLLEHFRHSPTCPFINNQPTDNVPTPYIVVMTQQPPQQHSPVMMSRPINNGRILMSSEHDRRRLKIIPAFGGPIQTTYVTLESRIKTYERNGWDSKIRPSPELMAKAGFYCLSDNAAICYYCDVLFIDWMKNSNPLNEHKRQQPNCLLCKLPETEEPIHEYSDVNTMSVEEIKTELIDLRNQRLCPVCLCRLKSFVFTSCGHLTCGSCAPMVKECPTCRSEKEALVNTFLFS